MIKYIKEKYPPRGRTCFDHVYVFTKSLVIVSCVDWRIGITLHIIIKRNAFVAYQLLEIIPVPFLIGGPFVRQLFYNHRYAGLIKFFPKHLRVDLVEGG